MLAPYSHYFCTFAMALMLLSNTGRGKIIEIRFRCCWRSQSMLYGCCRVPENEYRGNSIALQCKGRHVEKMRLANIKNGYIESYMANVDLFMK